MPDGRTHTSVTVLTAAYSTAFLVDRIVNDGYPLRSLVMVAGCLAGILLTPDLDVDAGNIGMSIIRTWLGGIPAVLWFWYWRPYSKLIPHRSVVSHLPILSTAIRLVYMFWWVPLLYGRFPDVGLWFIWFFAGLALVDLNHAFLNFIHPDKEDFR